MAAIVEKLRAQCRIDTDDATDDVLLALMLLVGHWYENRENSSDVSKAPVPFGFSSLLEPYRFIPL